MSAPGPQAVERLLYDEADCLDRADLAAWLELYTDDATYWMPVDPEQTDPRRHISLFYDSRLLMEIRRNNFGHEFAASMEYPVRCSHIISNIRIEAGSDPQTCRVTSNFQAVVYYKTQTVYAGRYTHELAADGNRWRIRHKRVDLINCDAEHGNLVVYL
ncbi:MAG: aromatic-ring-hydroxylating dioxygenase subunit beta [Gammaproteobacteria bacterium]